ncbi:MAG: hypothetical protein CMQ81_02520 [Gammaproteobacteria bacterium]|nr:hypothetical protein [Gammaproteobacteria bacterium]|tara:strand:+ start:24976 stop:25263 length:288 start_codon:yes stop_codon:yes gene_type:complete
MKNISSQIDISILEKAKILEIITNYLVKYTNSNNSCYACNIIDEVLVLGAIDSSNLNLARNYQREILKDINSKFYDLLTVKITKIKFKIIKNPLI